MELNKSDTIWNSDIPQKKKKVHKISQSINNYKLLIFTKCIWQGYGWHQYRGTIKKEEYHFRVGPIHLFWGKA